jgi:phage terminase large subunit-like protein
MKQEVIWRPNPGPQTRLLATRANEVLYGGAAGGGKSAALLACPLRWIHNPNYRGLYLRRQSKYLGEAIDKSEALYPKFGARLVRSPRNIWTFPSGATIWFNHCEHESDVANYDSFEFSEVLFDELTHFTQKQYKGIRARLRGTDPNLPYWSRSASNPGGEGHEWVFAHWRSWLDPQNALVRAKPGEVLWFLRDQIVPKGTRHATSRTFIPALLKDNPHVSDDYLSKLEELDAVRRAQLKDGDWLKKPAPKDYWDRERITHIDHPLSKVRGRARLWDLASSPTGNWTVGTLMSIGQQGVIAIEHMVRFRGAPDKVHAEFSTVSAGDKQRDPATVQFLPHDPGQAGTDQVRSFINENPGITIRARRPTGDKIVRFGPASARALAGLLVVVRGSWNGELHDELEAIPEGRYNDIMDTVSDGVAVLSGAPEESESPPPSEDDGRWSGYTEARGF